MMSGTKMDEDLGPDRGDDHFHTEDEENQAHRGCEQYETDSESDIIRVPTPNLSQKSIDINTNAWPQSYRQSIDMYTSVTPPSFVFLRASSITSNFSILDKRHSISSDSDSSSTRLLISQNWLDKEIPPSPSQAAKLYSSYVSLNELPPPQERCCSFSQAVINGVNVLCGIGLLTTPYAIREGGWLSLILLAFFGVICCYTGILLKRCLESCPGLRTYPDIGQAAFGSAGRFFLSIILYLELYAACVEFLTMMSDNLASAFPNTHMTFAGIDLDCHQIFAIISTLVILPTVWLQNLSLLSYLSVGGVVASILVALCLLWVGVVNQVGFHHKGSALNLADISVTIGIYGFGFAGHSVFPNIYTSMREPSQFSAVLITSVTFCFFIYTGVAVCGFMMFGDSIHSQFTLNMPKQFVASKISVWTTVVIPMTKYALTMTPVALSLEELFPDAWMGSHLVSIIVRTLLVLSTLVVAMNFPYFGSVMALIGSFVAMLVAVVFPCVCYLKLHSGRLTKLQIATCIMIISVGVVCSIIGTYSAISRIAEQIVE
ncbi:hypothetical protein ACFX2C_009682 [Malus domestica]